MLRSWESVGLCPGDGENQVRDEIGRYENEAGVLAHLGD